MQRFEDVPVPRPMVPADFGYSGFGAFAAISVALGLSGLLYLIH